MKFLLATAIIIASACCNSKKTTGSSVATNTDTVAHNDVPACVQEMIKKFNSLEKHDRPSKLYSYTYKGNTVFYMLAPCCDHFNELYDANCKLIGHPDGGFTGRGDGKITDWETEKKNEKLIWEDGSK